MRVSKRRKTWGPFLMVLSCVLLGACSRFQRSNEPLSGSEASMAGTSVAGAAEYEATIRKVVREHIDAASKTEDETRARLVSAPPYFYREWIVYPDGPASYSLNLRMTDSRTTPCAAEVKLNKIQYATRLHRKRGDAQDDPHFVRRTGTELLSYELKNGRWIKVSSFFNAEKVEQKVGDTWVSIAEDVQLATAAEEETQGFFGRIWSSIVNR